MTNWTAATGKVDLTYLGKSDDVPGYLIILKGGNHLPFDTVRV